MIDFQMEESGKVGKLTFEGEMTIEKVVEVKDALINALNQIDQVYIDVEKVSRVDLSFLQLLYSAFKDSKSKNKKIQMMDTMSDAFRLSVKEVGFSYINFFIEGSAYKN